MVLIMIIFFITSVGKIDLIILVKFLLCELMCIFMSCLSFQALDSDPGILNKCPVNIFHSSFYITNKAAPGLVSLY